MWFKIVDFLQQNWCIVHESEEGAVLTFAQDGGYIIDRLTYPTMELAERALRHNGFRIFEDDKKAQEFIGPPRRLPFIDDGMVGKNGIYSSGRFWREPPERPAARRPCPAVVSATEEAPDFRSHGDAASSAGAPDQG